MLLVDIRGFICKITVCFSYLWIYFSGNLFLSKYSWGVNLASLIHLAFSLKDKAFVLWGFTFGGTYIHLGESPGGP